MRVSPCVLLSRECQDWFADTPLSSNAKAYVQCLNNRGYTLRTIRSYLADVAHFAGWLARNRMQLVEVDELTVRDFIGRHLPRCRCVTQCRHNIKNARAALGRLLDHLRTQGRIVPCAARADTAVDRELHDFEHYLRQVCGLSAATRYYRLNHIRSFLLDGFGAGSVAISAPSGHDIEAFITRYTKKWTPQSRNAVCASLRSYLRFKALQGEPTASLRACIPTIASWRLARLPQVVSAADIERVFAAFDRRHATGRRDDAIAHCLVDLGLRTGEVPRIALDDIDWRAGTITIRGKGRRCDLLPLPAVTGRAITAYLRHGRPTTPSRALFVRHRAPLDAPITACIVRGIIRRTAKGCGVTALQGGPHLLRHTAAQRLIQGGATLKTVADFLRHRSLSTTTIYTKIDLHSLSEVALPWPGSVA